MHVIQSQFTNYSYLGFVQKQIKLLRWWRLENSSLNGNELALPFTEEQEQVLLNYMDDHPDNFPKEKREIFDSKNLVPPKLVFEDQDSDSEKPCVLLIRKKPGDSPTETCRRMDVVLQNDQLPIQLPFDIAGEVVLEKV